MSKGSPTSLLPRLVEPWKLIQKQAKLSGLIPAEGLPRLREVVCGITEVGAELEFCSDEQYRRLIKGRVYASLQLVCQRCLEPLEISVAALVNVALVRSMEEAKNLPSSLEPVIAVGEEVNVHEIVEEELLLNLPLVNRHDHKCIDERSLRSASQLPDGFEGGQRSERTIRPFQVLDKLRNREDES